MTEYISPTENDPIDQYKEQQGRKKEAQRQEDVKQGKGKK